MSGVEHYKEAERLLDSVGSVIDKAVTQRLSESTLNAAVMSIVAQAQVHATLALAAAQTDSAVLL